MTPILLTKGQFSTLLLPEAYHPCQALRDQQPTYFPIQRFSAYSTSPLHLMQFANPSHLKFPRPWFSLILIPLRLFLLHLLRLLSKCYLLLRPHPGPLLFSPLPSAGTSPFTSPGLPSPLDIRLISKYLLFLGTSNSKDPPLTSSCTTAVEVPAGHSGEICGV